MRGKTKGLILLAVLFVSSVSSGSVELAGEGFIPEPNQEITVQIQTDTLLFCMGLIITVTGDANITGAVSTADCNIYGWDPDWPTDPYIDPEGWLYISGVSWEGQAEGVVGYLKFRYNSGEVTVSIIEGDAYDANCEPVPISDKTLVFGEPDPNDYGKEGESPSQDIIIDENIPATAESPNDVNIPFSSYWQNKLADRQKHLMRCPADENGGKEVFKKTDWQERTQFKGDGGGPMLLDGEPNIIEINSDITTNQIWTANNIYWVTAPINVQALLVIEPNTMVIFGYDCGLFVNNGGTLISKGTPDEPIIYTCDFLYFEYPEYISYYWYYFLYYYEDWYYFCPIYIEKTASPATTIMYNFIEGANYGILTDNISLDTPIENNYLFGNFYGIFEYGTKHTDIRNNLCFFNDVSGIDVNLADVNGVADANSVITIENNTCDTYQYYGITVHGVSDGNNIGTVMLINNIVSESYIYGLNLVDGYMYAIVSNTGYYDNTYYGGANKNWDFNEYNPVEANEFPYIFGEKPYENHYLIQSCPFIDAGLQYVEETLLVGKATDIYGLPDCNKIDIGFHYPNWDYSNAGWTSLMADLNNDFIVDYKDLEIFADYWLSPFDFEDFTILANEWRKTTETVEPNIQIDIYGDGSNGYVEVGISNYGLLNTCQAFLLVDGQYEDNLFGFQDDQHALVNVAALGSGPHQFKVISMDSNSRITCSHIKEAEFDSPFNYTACNYAYEVNKPLYFCAYVQDDANVIVKAVDDENNVLWMATYADGNVNGFVPAAITGTYTIDQLVFEKNPAGGMLLMDEGESSSSVSLSVTPSFDPKNIWTDVRALIVTPDPSLNILDAEPQKVVKNAFTANNIKYYELKESQATSYNMAWFAQNRNIQYLYINAHGNYKPPMCVALRTCIKLSDGTFVSFNRSDFEPNYIPSWCDELYVLYENRGSIFSMGFHTLKFAHFDGCYSGRLQFSGGRLIEGPWDNTELAFDFPNDMALALGIIGDEESVSFYQGWYVDICPGDFSSSMYSKFTGNEWRNLHDGYTFYESLLFAILQDNQKDPACQTFPSNHLRLFGGGLLFYIEGLE